MHQIGVVGLSYRHASTEYIARFSLPRAELASRLPALRDALGAGELVYIGTCNRVEILFASRDDLPAGDHRNEAFRALTGRDPRNGEASRLLRAWAGEAAVEHLFLLACGLDSAQAGEHEIAAQLRAAWEAAREAGVCGPLLDRLMGEALSMASRVHRCQAGVRPPSLADLAVDRLLKDLGPRPGTVALVGISPMTRRCAERLHEAGVPLLIVNRTMATAEELAESLSARALSLDDLRVYPPDLAALIFAAGGTGPILDEAALRRLRQNASRAPMIVDFGVPPNVEPSAARAVGLPRIGMDELVQAARERRIAELMRLAPVRAAIDDRLARLRQELVVRAIGPRLTELRTQFERIAATEVDHLLATELSDLDERQKQVLQRFATTVARRLAHLPLAGLRAAAPHASAEAVDAFFREARLTRVSNTGKKDS